MFQGMILAAPSAMRRRLSIIVAVIGLCLIAVIFLIRRQADNFVYQGRKVQAWVQQLNSVQPGAAETAKAAFKAMGPRAVPALIRILETTDPGLRRRVWLLGRKLPRKLRAAFFQKLDWPDVNETRAAAAKALGLMGPDAQPAIPALGLALRSPARQVSVEAANALGHIGKSSVPVLMELLRDKDESTRHVAAYALGEIGPDAGAAVPALVGMLSETNEPLRRSVVYSLSRIGPQEVSQLVGVLNHGNGSARVEAARVLLGYYRSLRVALPALANLAHEESPVVRQEASEVFGVLREADLVALGWAVQALKDPSAEVRLAAVKAMGNVLSPAELITRSLTNCLKDQSAQVRAAAARTLGTFGHAAQAAVPSLTGSLEDKDEPVRTAAREALSLIQCANTNGLRTAATNESQVAP